MGQQQLILLVLGIVVVGLAVTIGINVFSEKSVESDFDTIAAESMKVAGNVLAWKSVPRSLGGGNGATFLTGLTFDAMGYESSGENQKRANNSRFMRSINDLDSARPYIIVRSMSNRDLRVQLIMYGNGANCLHMRRSTRTESGWEEADMDVSQAPAGCKGW